MLSLCYVGQTWTETVYWLQQNDPKYQNGLLKCIIGKYLPIEPIIKGLHPPNPHKAIMIDCSLGHIRSDCSKLRCVFDDFFITIGSFFNWLCMVNACGDNHI